MRTSQRSGSRCRLQRHRHRIRDGAVSAKGPIAPETIVCTSQDNLDVANLPAVAKSEVVLRALGCRRSEGTGVWKLLRNART